MNQPCYIKPPDQYVVIKCKCTCHIIHVVGGTVGIGVDVAVVVVFVFVACIMLFNDIGYLSSTL